MTTNQGFKSIIPNSIISVDFLYYKFNTLKNVLIKLVRVDEIVPISSRVRRKAVRERRAKTTVSQIMMGSVTRLARANGKLRANIAITMPTREKTLPMTWVRP